MVNRIGGSGGKHPAISAALNKMQGQAQDIARRAGDTDGPSASSMESVAPPEKSFGKVMKEGLATVEGEVDKANNVHLDALAGRLDLHEVATQLKESELTFQFALQVRNKLMDAYREVMRMSM